MSSIVISGDTSGAITLAAPAVSGTNTATLPAATGTVMVSGNMPAFSAYSSSASSFTLNTFTKVPLQVKSFDTANAFDATTNYRFQPTVAGYYQLNGMLYGSANAGMTAIYIQINKTNTLYQYGAIENIAVGTSNQSQTINTLIYLNGSTDYVELYGTIVGTGTCSYIATTGSVNWFNGVLVRTA